MPEEMPEPARTLQMLAGFQISQALYVVAKLGLSTALADGPRTIEQLATATGATADALRRITRSLAPLGIFRTDRERIEATPLGLTLAEGYRGSLRDIALYWMETHYAPYGELLHTAMTGENAATRLYGKPFLAWVADSPAMAEIQTRAMASVTEGLRAGMFDGYSLPEGKVVADIGGADGAMLCELLAREPGRRGIVFDLPEIVPAARKTLARRGLAARVDVRSGDLFESVPAADVHPARLGRRVLPADPADHQERRGSRRASRGRRNRDPARRQSAPCQAHRPDHAGHADGAGTHRRGIREIARRWRIHHGPDRPQPHPVLVYRSDPSINHVGHPAVPRDRGCLVVDKRDEISGRSPVGPHVRFQMDGDTVGRRRSARRSLYRNGQSPHRNVLEIR
jgi:hypothetical protein